MAFSVEYFRSLYFESIAHICLLLIQLMFSKDSIIKNSLGNSNAEVLKNKTIFEKKKF